MVAVVLVAAAVVAVLVLWFWGRRRRCCHGCSRCVCVDSAFVAGVDFKGTFDSAVVVAVG